MTAPNRAALIERLFKVLRKHYKPALPDPGRTVLQQLLYAAILERGLPDKADIAFRKVQQVSFDWNEVRVTTVSELAEMMVGLHEPRVAATNFKRILHSVFEGQYSYDIDHLRNQNLGKTQSDLAKHPGASPFIVDYVTQHALGGHAIPLNLGSFDVLYIVGIIAAADRDARTAPGLERAIPKKSGIEFASLLHQLGTEFWMSPFSNKVRAILVEVQPSAKDRFPKRISKQPPTAPEPEPPAKRDSKKAAAKKLPEKVDPKSPAATKLAPKPAPKSTSDKPAPPKSKPVPAPSSAKKKPVKPLGAASKSQKKHPPKKNATQSLGRKKPK